MPRHLDRARIVVDDEFYTQMSDIENELKNYKYLFRNKVVYCNCDDPSHSNFVKYFVANFEALGIKKLLASCYENPQRGLFDVDVISAGKWLEYAGGEFKMNDLEGDGDFNSLECRNLLDEADLIVTNPPFSLFREFVELLIEKEKEFIVVGPLHAVGYKSLFQFIKSRRLFLGESRTAMKFKRPKKEKLVAVSARWFVTFPSLKIAPFIILTEKYSPERYPKYDNYDAINVDRTKDIPVDYFGEIGVPISFIERWNPEQFEIVGMSKNLPTGMIYLNGEKLFVRVFIKQKPPTSMAFL